MIRRIAIALILIGCAGMAGERLRRSSAVEVESVGQNSKTQVEQQLDEYKRLETVLQEKIRQTDAATKQYNDLKVVNEKLNNQTRKMQGKPERPVNLTKEQEALYNTLDSLGN